ncbi:hypothetical protein M3616_22155 [Bacillus velezensis]|uniref:hypothetical protein n=1 Tax=Bacillus velezensis TaxID=492670 RepID=UPI00203D6FFC|nr:hypothetical protein [Bacillus velezensis]MCM3278800.1 hypothetical protein [Bacillus velezensis]MCM3351879.1 hypothetical protein [Bacillus velezensis]MDQ9149956.1 hypothetical protein [Bacillus velezensis]
MSGMVTLKQGDFYYNIPMHEYSRYWFEHLDIIEQGEECLVVEKIPYDKIPKPSIMAAMKRGKGVKRVVKAYSTKGSGKHANDNWR